MGLPFGKYLAERSYLVKGSTRSEAKLGTLKSVGIDPFIIELSAGGNYIERFFQSDVLFLNIPPGRKDPELTKNYVAKISSILPFLSKNTKVIFASSTGVYPNSNGLVNENSDTNPVRKSGEAILKAEQLIRENCDQWIITRFGGLVGGDRKAGAFLSGKKNLDKGNALVNMVHQLDCIRILHLLLESALNQEIFNVVADKHPDRKTFYSYRAELEGFEAPTFNDVKGDFKMVDNAKVKQLLSYEFLYPDPMDFPV